MKLKSLLFCFAFTLLNIQAQNIPLYVGTYTNGESEGIYQFEFNTETGSLNNKQLAINIDNPSFLAYSPDKKHLYSVNQSEDGYVSSYKINNDGTLLLLTRVSSNGEGPCHISINENGDKIVVSNYNAGTVSIYPINKDGSLKEASQIFNHNSANEKSHAHSAKFSKDDLFVSDLGRNAIYHYKITDDSYKLESPSIVKMEGNPGPRHFSLDKKSKFLYVINEYGCSIASIKKTKKGFKQIDFDSTLDENYEGKNKCADIHLSKDGRFLYGSNRGENSIAVFKRNTKNGTLDKIQNMSVHGDWPRNFSLDPTGKFLLAANKKSNNISVFKIDNESGKLTFLHATDLPAPVCLLF
ncbi:lactonase family protein [Flavivirga rizhaonensis]|uniref:Lactonase family protein n=1 Tax=Flavivirga rizhaonensis TaxID=2559571 RepID=A0A4S1DXZ2_9FLAO|nr:lactonase family protein [Flavivirga rizhaonensis]TGV02823.1 lactonase family protein [Flavivirga rizhaonensis]